jgi:curved DNA-binding protein CbpA
MEYEFYNRLGVSRQADQDMLRRAYRRLAQTHHPDKGGDVEEFQRIQEAYDVLSDPEKRARYDQTGTVEPRRPSANDLGLQILAQQFAQWLNGYVSQGYTICPVDFIKNHLHSQKHHAAMAQSQIASAVAALEKLVPCISVAHEMQADPFLSQVQQRLGDLKRQQEQNDYTLTGMRAAEQMLPHFTFTPATGMRPRNQMFGSSIYSTGTSSL